MLLGAARAREHGPGFLERMYPVGGSYVQTLEADGDGVVQRFLDRRGPGLHHVAFTVDAIDAALADLEARGVRVDRPARATGGMGTRVAFVHPSAIGGMLVELVEEPGAGPWITKRWAPTGTDRVHRAARPAQGDGLGLRGDPRGDHRPAPAPGEPLREATIADAAGREQDADPRGAHAARAGRTRRDDLVQGCGGERVLAARPRGDLRAAEPPGGCGRPGRRGRRVRGSAAPSWTR